MVHDPHSKIYTRTGDAGQTALFDGTRVSKSSPRVGAYGDVDELASCLGVARSRLQHAEIAAMVDGIQKDLFALGAMLADPDRRIAERVVKAAVTDQDIARLEAWIDALDARLPPLRRFILSGGSEPGALLHLSRSVCRRAERAMVALGPDAVPGVTLVYVNRLSDLLFVMARAVNADLGVPEIEW